MEDLDRLFALIDLVSNPATAKKNAADMKAVREEKSANTKLLKEINAERFALNKDKDALQAGWADLNTAKAAQEEKDREIEREKQQVENMRAAAIEEINGKKSQMKGLEDEHAKKISELEARRKSIESQISAALKRKQQAETELAKVKQIINA